MLQFNYFALRCLVYIAPFTEETVFSSIVYSYPPFFRLIDHISVGLFLNYFVVLIYVSVSVPEPCFVVVVTAAAAAVLI